jgi:hypothetical protein
MRLGKVNKKKNRDEPIILLGGGKENGQKIRFLCFAFGLMGIIYLIWHFSGKRFDLNLNAAVSIVFEGDNICSQTQRRLQNSALPLMRVAGFQIVCLTIMKSE